MSRNRIWTVLVSLVFLGTLLYSSRAFIELYQFLSLNESTQVRFIEPHIQKLSNGRYRLKVRYHYSVKEQSYSREQTVTKYPFKNRWAAQDTFAKLQEISHTAWYSEKYPEKGKFNKSFPIKGLFSAGLLIGISIYFYLLGRYMFKIE